MEFPFGHPHHSHHRRDEEREDDYPPPPPPSNLSFFDRPPPPPPPSFHGADQPPPPPFPEPAHVYHSSRERPGLVSDDFEYSDYPPPPPRPGPQTDSYSYNYSSEVPPPPPASAQHVSHEVHHHGDRPHAPSFSQHKNKQVSSHFVKKPTVKVFSKADPDYYLTIQDGKLILAPSNPSDEFQHWYKDEKYSTRVKDEEGFPCFALVNKATGQAVKHAIGATHPVQLIQYNPDVLDESILWSESKDFGKGFRTIRMFSRIGTKVITSCGRLYPTEYNRGKTVVP
ncbi:hypothetical protein L6164_004844 [Bauhinia variegata]|uniref:Uncharacterized protein n=1 Tax=Bauhinia variegata TaxID=167791 RepID=A0ACB9PPA4_BAUVA|nr:hypothetical protein L6164_004844 [Bauhinia variegata]